MKRKISRRDFLKLAGAGAAASSLLGYRVFQESSGDPIVERYPYQDVKHTGNPNGSVPLLIITNEDLQDRFGAYLTELLRAEGVNCFHTVDLSSLAGNVIQKYDVVILAETSLTLEQVETLEGYVAQGGRLVSMRPAGGFESVFGLEKSGGTLSEAYIKTERNHPASAGINPSTLQFHGTADLHIPAGAEVIAWLCSDRETVTMHPAITANRFGEGIAVAFTFNLSQSIAYMRQGNPALADKDLDGLDGARTVDLFVDWIDLERIHIPQADEQQRLFVNILNMLSDRPLPRLWYFPEDSRSVLIATGDSHSNPAPFIDDVLRRVDERGGHITIYYSPQIVSELGRAERWLRFWLTDNVAILRDILGREFGSPTPAMLEGWRARGHEITLHPYVETGLDEWHLYWKEFTGRGYGPVSQTVRTHRVLWTGWAETARVQAMHGMRMNFDYYHVGPSLQKKNGEWVYGHLTGSGRPMKFIDEQGRMIDLYQQLTQLADEHLLPMDVPGWGGWPQLSGEQAIEISKYLLDRSVKHGDYCAIGVQFHVDPFQLGGAPAEKGAFFLEGTLDYANEMGVPIISSQEWLNFTDLRHDAEFTELVWDAGASTLTCYLVPAAASHLTLTVLFPARRAEKTIGSVRVDGVTYPTNARLVLGSSEYVQISLSAQKHWIKVDYS